MPATSRSSGRDFQVLCTDFVHISAPPYTFLSFSHVCRHWRQVALDYPTIWTRLDLSLGEVLTMQMLRRAKSAPFSFFGDITHSADGFLQELSDAYANIVTLYLIGTHGALDLFVARLKEPIPFLTSLTISFSTECELSSHSYPLRSSALEDFIHPRLRRLRLNNVAIPWSSKCISSLTSLEISLPKTSPSELRTILHAIARNPLLENLDLSIWNDVKSWTTPIPLVLSEHVTLNSLRKMALGGPIYLILHVLHNLIYPDLRCFKVHSLECCSSSTAIRSLIDAVKARRVPPLIQSRTCGFLRPIDFLGGSASRSIMTFRHCPSTKTRPLYKLSTWRSR